MLCDYNAAKGTGIYLTSCRGKDVLYLKYRRLYATEPTPTHIAASYRGFTITRKSMETRVTSDEFATVWWRTYIHAFTEGDMGTSGEGGGMITWVGANSCRE